MRIAFSSIITGESLDVAVLAKTAEGLGYDSFWVGEHPIFPVVNTAEETSPYGDIPPAMAGMVDAFVALARASGVTQRLKLGTAVLIIPEHNPLRLAKEVATLDHYSGGRVIFGVGAGWLNEETQIMGGDIDHRWGQTRESVLAMKELWTKDEAEFHGKFYDFPAVRSSPKPSQKPHPPVLFGGNTPNVFKRIISLGDGWIPTRVTPEEIKSGREELTEMAVWAGRDPNSLDITIFGVPGEADAIRAYEEAGADRVIVRLPNSVGEAAVAHLEAMASELRPWMLA